ncbi:MAG TPA: tetratricopeptide repeat protein [Elusimicrobiales bacterium]|nr:tetratricopeptide repeat protein [Elusimicrobiales bacterium]
MHLEDGALKPELTPPALRETPDWRALLRAAFYFLAIMLPLAFYLRTYDSAMVKITILQFGALAAAAIWLAGSIADGRFEVPEKSVPLLLPAVLLFAWNALRFAFSDHRLASLYGFLLQEIFLLTFVVVSLAFSRTDMRRTLLMLMGAWCVAVIYGILQYLGLDPFIWRGAFGSRVFSTLANPTLFAAYLVICVPIGLALASDRTEPAWLRAVSGALAVAGAFLLQRTGEVVGRWAFLFSVGVFAAMYLRGSVGRPRAAILLLSAACALAATLPLTGELPPPANNRRYAFLSETWKGTAELIKARPVLGSGPGSFWVHYPAFRRAEIFAMEGKHNNQTDHPENELLEQWADGGLPGVLLWLWLFGGLLLRGARTLAGNGAGSPAPYGAGLFAAVGGSVVLMLGSISSRFPAPGWHIYFAAGLLAVLAAKGTDEEERVLAMPLPLKRSKYILLLPVITAILSLKYASVRAFQSDLAHNIAIYYSKTMQWEQAVRTYEKEVPWSGSYIMSRYFLGNVRMDEGAGDPQGAVEYYRQVRSLAPDYVQVHYREGVALQKAGRYKEAAERLERQVRLDPVWPDAWKALSGVYEALGDHEKAAYAEKRAEGTVKSSAANPSVARAAQRSLLLGGIGMRASFPDGRMTIDEVTRNGPADAAGLGPGDQIFDITALKPEDYTAGNRVFRPREFTAEQAALALTGEPGTKVTLIVRPATGQKEAVPLEGAGPGWRGRVRVVQLERRSVRVLPDDTTQEAAIRYIAASGSF